MKLLIDGSNILAEVNDNYISPDNFILIDKPVNFDFSKSDKYHYVYDDVLESMTLKRKVPEFVTMRQARLILASSGYLSSINTFISSISDTTQKELATIEWEYAIVVNRNSSLVSTIATELNLTDSQIDALFIAADDIPD